MSKINYHGLTIKGIKAAAAETKNCTNAYGPVVELFYDTEEGKVWANYQVSENSWSVYDEPSIIRVANARSPMTMQQIADAVYDAVCARH